MLIESASDGKKTATYKDPIVRLDPKNEIKGRLAAAAALTAYGQALTALLDKKTQEGELAAATDKLTSALKAIPSSVLKDAKISADNIDGLGKVLVSFGDIYLDYRRREVLQTVVPVAEPIVNNICRLFAKDFDVHGVWFGEKLPSDAKDTLILASAAIRDNGNTLNNRSILVPLYLQVDNLREKMDVAYTSLMAAANSCVKSSITLRRAVENPTTSLDDIIDFATKAEAAYSAVQTLNKSK